MSPYFVTFPKYYLIHKKNSGVGYMQLVAFWMRYSENNLYCIGWTIFTAEYFRDNFLLISAVVLDAIQNVYGHFTTKMKWYYHFSTWFCCIELSLKIFFSINNNSGDRRVVKLTLGVYLMKLSWLSWTTLERSSTSYLPQGWDSVPYVPFVL